MPTNEQIEAVRDMPAYMLGYHHGQQGRERTNFHSSWGQKHVDAYATGYEVGFAEFTVRNNELQFVRS